MADSTGTADDAPAGAPPEIDVTKPHPLAFSGLELVDPGVVLVSEWRPEEAIRPLPSEVNTYGGVARKP